MTPRSPALDELLSGLLAACPLRRDARPGEEHLEVPEVLHRLAMTPPGSEEAPEDAAALEALVRKVKVAGCLRRRYRPGWRARKGEDALGGEWLLLLAALLLARAGGPPTDEPGRARRLKYLDAALAARDLAERAGVPADALGRLEDLFARALAEAEGDP